MKSYRPAQPRAAFGAAAVVVMLLNFALLVILPSKTEADAETFAMRVRASTAAVIRFVAPTLKSGGVKQTKPDGAVPKYS